MTEFCTPRNQETEEQQIATQDSVLKLIESKLTVKGSSHLLNLPPFLKVIFLFMKLNHTSFMNHCFYLLVISFTFNTNPAFQNPIKIHFANINPRVNPDKKKQLRDVFVFNASAVKKLELY